MAADNTVVFSDLSDDAVTYIREELLDIAEKDVVFAQFADQAPLPQHNSKAIQFSRYPRLNLPKLPLTEGVTPDGTTYSVETVQAVVDQWGMVVTLSDLAQITLKHPQIPIINERLGLAMAELVDREIQKVLNASTAVVFAGGKASRGLLAGGDVISTVELSKLWRTLRRNGARAYGRFFVMVVDPEVSQDVIQEDLFRDAHVLAQATALFNNEIGNYTGFRFVVSNYIPIYELIADSAWSVAAAGGGAWAGGDNVDFYVKITGVDDEFGFESLISNPDHEADLDNNEKLNIVFPSTAGYTYNVYASDTTATSTDANLHLVSTGNLPSSTLDLTTVITDFPATTAGNNPPASPPSGVSVHISYALGKMVFSMVKLSGDNLRVYATPAVPSDSDPLVQRRKLGFKGSFKNVITNDDWMRRFESASAF